MVDKEIIPNEKFIEGNIDLEEIKCFRSRKTKLFWGAVIVIVIFFGMFFWYMFCGRTEKWFDVPIILALSGVPTAIMIALMRHFFPSRKVEDTQIPLHVVPQFIRYFQDTIK